MGPKSAVSRPERSDAHLTSETVGGQAVDDTPPSPVDPAAPTGPSPLPVVRFAGIVLLLALFWVGCSGTPTPTPVTAGDADLAPIDPVNLKKKIGLAPFRVESAYGDPGMVPWLQNAFVSGLGAQCPDLRAITPGDDNYPEMLTDLPRLENGRIDNFEVAMIGREQGLQALVYATLVSISPDRRDVGFWWFKGVEYFVRMEIRFEIFDTETAAKLMDRTVTQNLEIDVFDYDQARSQTRVDSYIIEELLEKIVGAVTATACERLDQEPWKNFVTASRGGEVLIAAGRRSGLRPGHILDVYESAGVIDGAEGQRYIKPGKKIGTVQVKIAFAETAQGIRLSGHNPPAGSVVKIRH